MAADGKALRSLLSTIGCEPSQPAGAVAAILFEPISSQSVDSLGPAGASCLRFVCAEYGIPLLSDETRCGLGRCGELLLAESWGVAPDCTILGEALGGGIASVAAVIYDHKVLRGALPSTATTMNDNTSSHIGLATLTALEQWAPRTRIAADAFEDAVREALRISPQGDGIPFRLPLPRLLGAFEHERAQL